MKGMSRRRLMLVLCIVIIAAVTAVVIGKRRATAPDASKAQGNVMAEVKADVTPPLMPPVFDKQQLSLEDPASVWVIANKVRPLKPRSFAPVVAAPAMKLRLSADTPEMQISTRAIADLQRLDSAAKAAGLQLMLASGYRSYDTQIAVYSNEVKNYGQAQADRQSARPGHSEHQTGLAIDLAPASGKCLIAECFGELPEGQWLAAHAHEFGFVIRYPQGKEAITGYLYEPWHVRYVGPTLAAELNRLGNPTLEEFFGLPAAPSY